MIKKRGLAALGLMLSVGLVACTDDEGDGITEPPGPQASIAYLGSEACGTCHGVILAEFRKSGHPYKLSKVVDGQPPARPFSQVPSPPAGFTWNDVAYMIGGFGWKARFVGQDGFIITAGGQNQYNLATGTFSDYHKDEKKPYDCGRCHTTAYRSDGNQDDLPGLVGQWEFPGIQCEECHGPGSLHANSPEVVAMTVDTRAETCGGCHNRGGVNNEVIAKGGFIRHHEQYNEMAAGPHTRLECVTCHDPHTGVRYNDLEGAQAIVAQCEACHSKARAALASAPLSAKKADFACESCHMPFAGKSALASGQFVGDVRTHLVQINADVGAAQFDGGLANPYVTLDFACLGCHDDKDRAWAASYVDDIHGADFSSNRVAAPAKLW